MLRCSRGANGAPSLHQRGALVSRRAVGGRLEVYIWHVHIKTHIYSFFSPPVTVHRSAAGNWTFILVSVCDIYTFMQTLYIELQTTNKGV